jgi:type I restriction enzyme R subunit
MKHPDDPLKLVIVRDMWLTGFDAPSLHTLYIDKPMKGHNLMQAIARVNRVYKDKPGGLIVDYLKVFLCALVVWCLEISGPSDELEVITTTG